MDIGKGWGIYRVLGAGGIDARLFGLFNGLCRMFFVVGKTLNVTWDQLAGATMFFATFGYLFGIANVIGYIRGASGFGAIFS